MGRIYNFSAGPATLPEAVLKEAAEEMLDYRANRNKWLKPHIPSNNLYDVLRLKTVEECHANLPSKMILARYFYAITKMCVSSITG